HRRRGRGAGAGRRARPRFDPHARDLRAAYLPGARLRKAHRTEDHAQTIMRFVTIDTVRDHGAAAILDEALRGEGIVVELKRGGMNPYLGQAVEIEVRVPEDRVDDAQAILAQIRIEAEDALTIAAGKSESAVESEDEDAEEPAPKSVEGPAGA